MAPKLRPSIVMIGHSYALPCIRMRSGHALSSAFSELENDHEVWAGLRWSVHGGVAAEGGHSESDGGGGAAVDLDELVLGAGEADLESFGFAGPAFAGGFGDAGGEVVADLGDAGPAAFSRSTLSMWTLCSCGASTP
jgi:hypothetical protein